LFQVSPVVGATVALLQIMIMQVKITQLSVAAPLVDTTTSKSCWGSPEEKCYVDVAEANQGQFEDFNHSDDGDGPLAFMPM
jgi:hypothetical protein